MRSRHVTKAMWYATGQDRRGTSRNGATLLAEMQFVATLEM